MPSVRESILSYQGHALPHDARKDSAKLDSPGRTFAKRKAKRLESLNGIASSAAQRRSNYGPTQSHAVRRSQTQECKPPYSSPRACQTRNSRDDRYGSEAARSPSTSPSPHATSDWGYKAVETPLRTGMLSHMALWPRTASQASASSMRASVVHSPSRPASTTRSRLDLDREEEMNDAVNLRIQELGKEAERIFMAYECNQTISSAISGYYGGQINAQMVKALTLYGIAAEKYDLPDLACRAQLWKAILLHNLDHTEEVPIMLADILWLIIQTGLPSDQYQYRRLWIEYSRLIWDHLRSTAIAENLPHLAVSYHDFDSKVLEFLDHNLSDSVWSHVTQTSHIKVNAKSRDSRLTSSSAERELQKARVHIELLQRERENLRIDNARYKAERELFSHQADGPLSTAFSQGGQYRSDQHQLALRDVDFQEDSNQVINWLTYKHTQSSEPYHQSPGRPRWGHDMAVSRDGRRLGSIAGTHHFSSQMSDPYVPMTRSAKTRNLTETGQDDATSIGSRESPNRFHRRGPYREPHISSRLKRLDSWRSETMIGSQHASSGRNLEYVGKDSDANEVAVDHDTKTQTSFNTAEMAELFRGFSGDWKQLHRRPSSITSPRSNTWWSNSARMGRVRHDSGTTSTDFAHSFPSARPSPLVVRANQPPPFQKLPSLQPEELPFTDTPSPTKLIFDNPDFESHQKQRRESVTLEFSDDRASPNSNMSGLTRQQERPRSLAANADDQAAKDIVERSVASVRSSGQPGENDANGSDSSREHYGLAEDNQSVERRRPAADSNSTNQPVSPDSSTSASLSGFPTSGPLQKVTSAVANKYDDLSSLGANAKAILERATDSSSASKRRSKNILDRCAPLTPTGKSPPASAVVVSGSTQSSVHGWSDASWTEGSSLPKGRKRDQSPPRVAPGDHDAGIETFTPVEPTSLSATAPEFVPYTSTQLKKLMTSTHDGIHEPDVPAQPKVSRTMQRDRRPLAINTQQVTKAPVARKLSQPHTPSPLKATSSLNDEDGEHDDIVSKDSSSNVLQAPSISEVQSQFSPSSVRRFSARFGSFGVDDTISQNDTRRGGKDDLAVHPISKSHQSSHFGSTSVDTTQELSAAVQETNQREESPRAIDARSNQPSHRILETVGMTGLQPQQQKSPHADADEELGRLAGTSRESGQWQNDSSLARPPSSVSTQGAVKDNAHDELRSPCQTVLSQCTFTSGLTSSSSDSQHDDSAAGRSTTSQQFTTDKKRRSEYEEINDWWQQVSPDAFLAIYDTSAESGQRSSLPSKPSSAQDTQPVSPPTQDVRPVLSARGLPARRPPPARAHPQAEQRQQEYQGPDSLHKNSIASEYSNYEGNNPDTPAFPPRSLPLPVRWAADEFLSDDDANTPWGLVTRSVQRSSKRLSDQAYDSSSSSRRQGTSEISVSPRSSYIISDDDNDIQSQDVSPTEGANTMTVQHGQDFQRGTSRAAFMKTAPSRASGLPLRGEDHDQSTPNTKSNNKYSGSEHTSTSNRSAVSAKVSSDSRVLATVPTAG